MGVLRVHRHKRDFTITANVTPRNQRMSLRARGLLWFLLSQPDGYPVNAAEIAREIVDAREDGAPAIKEGREAIETAIKELVFYGYLRRRREQNSLGHWITYTDVFEVPELAQGTDGDCTQYGRHAGQGLAKGLLGTQNPVADAVARLTGTDNGSPVVGKNRRSEHKTAGHAGNGSTDAGSPVAMDQGLTDKDQEQGQLLPVEQARPAGVNGHASVELVFDTWRRSTGKHRAQLDSRRRAKIRAALKAYPPKDVLAAVQGWANSPHHCGQNDRGTVYNDLELLLRDAKHIEQFRDLHNDGPARPQAGRRTLQALGTYQAMLNNPPEGISSNGNGMGAVGGNRWPPQRELSGPANRAANCG